MRANRDWEFRCNAVRGTQLPSSCLAELADCRGCHSDVSISTFTLAKATLGGCVPWSSNCDPFCSSLYCTDLLPKDLILFFAGPVACQGVEGQTYSSLPACLLSTPYPRGWNSGFLILYWSALSHCHTLDPWLELCVHSLLSATAACVSPLFRSYFKQVSLYCIWVSARPLENQGWACSHMLANDTIISLQRGKSCLLYTSQAD